VVSSPAQLFDDDGDDETGDVVDDERASSRPGARDQASGRADSGAHSPVDTRSGGRGRQDTAARRSEPTTDLPAGLGAEDDDLDEDVEHAGSGLKAWLVLIGQGIAGAVGGALLWVGFRYLWLNLPVVALAAAVVATAGLVLVVRTIRGSEDLQTTMLALLVGLIVTISPAVLLLALH
jgi:hypothetical protein